MATDITDPIVLITLGQTIVLTLTLVIFIYQFRSQNQALRDATYQKALDDYTSTITLLVERPELTKILDDLTELSGNQGPKFRDLGPEQKTFFGYFLLQYSLFERIFLLYQKKGIDEDTWSQWYAWMKNMSKHPMFREVHRISEGTFDTAFYRLVAEEIRIAG